MIWKRPFTVSRSTGTSVAVLTAVLIVSVLLFSGTYAEGKTVLAQVAGSHSTKEPPVLLFPKDGRIEISSDGPLERNPTTNTYSIKGNVTVAQGNTRLRADSVEYEVDTGKITASGKVIARSGNDVIEAEKVVIQLKTVTGVLYNGKLFLTRQNIFLEGKKLEKTGESTYRIEDGSFTTCNSPRPDWRIRGKDLDVTLEGYGTLKHGFFYIKDIPVFYLPWLVYPAKRQRQSGFLMPSLANSSLRGFDVRFPFFLALSPSVDATLIPRICTNRALQAALEFRYNPYEEMRGTFYGEYTNDWKYRPETNRRSHRFYVTLRHDQELPGQVKFKVHGNWISDRDYFEFWGTRFDRRLRVRYLESTAILLKQWDNFLFRTEARHYDNLDLPDNAMTVQNIPSISGNALYQQIPYTPFYMSSNLHFDHFYSPIMNRQWLGTRAQLNTRLGLPIALGSYLKMEPSMTYFAKAYTADYYEREKSISSVNSLRTDLYQVNTDLFTDLSAVYNKGFLGFQRVKHNIRPRVAWVYRPFTSHQRYPYFDETDRMDRVSLLTAEMRHTFTGRLGPREYLDFVTLRLSQGYDFFNTRAPADPLGEKSLQPSNWTNTQFELILKPLSLVDLTAQAEYDPVMNRARRYSFNMGLMDHRGDLVRVLHQFTDDEKREDLNRQTNVNLQVKVTPSLDCFFENQYSHQFNLSYFTSVGINYHPQCWNVLLRYSETREQDPVTRKIKEPDQTVFMTVSLYGLGQIYRFSRDWAEILGHSPESTNNSTTH